MLKENKGHCYIKGAGEDYLLAVYTIRRDEDLVRQIEIAAHMGLSKVSVTRAVKILAQEGFLQIVQEKNVKEVHLTEAGRALGEKLYRRRRVVTAFLRAFGLSEADAAAEAHRWEHGVSDETTDAMEAALARGADRTAPKRPEPSWQRQKNGCCLSERAGVY
jgi:Mn-dependent DtxR family transcriptional regulator